ncbi:ABC transporter permease [Phytohabitans kaempferiae]|uniref:ABC transporter permease n=1 Tax=Phytohabitans kaempferiae TaxID=1620943 RepID=A0ABV6LYL9_9ACTN
MFRYIVKRLLHTIPTLFLLAVGLFILVRVVPGDPVLAMVGENATPEQIEALREQLNLNDPIHTQFLAWLGDLARGDFGNSVQLRRPVTDLITPRIPVTLTLAILATLLTVVLAIPAGVLAAAHKGRAADRLALSASLVGVSVPSFFVGMMLMLVFAVNLRWFPTSGYRPLSEGLWTSLQGFVLPAVTLGALYAAVVTRMSRTSMLEVLSQDYVVTAQASGFGRRRVLYRHALKNALIPIVTVVGLNLGSLLGGSLVTERVFNLPGLGTLLLSSIERRDYPVIQAIVLLVTLTYVVINLIVDIVYAMLDPRVRYAD